MQENIEDEFFKKGVVLVPDFVANAGGVISSYAEYRGYNPKQMFETVKKKIAATTLIVMKKSIEKICRNCKHWKSCNKTLDVNFPYEMNSSKTRQVGICDVDSFDISNYSTETYSCDKFALVDKM